MFQCPGWMRKNFIPGNFSWRVVAETWDASCFKKGLLEKQEYSKHLHHIAIEKDILSELNRCIFQISLKHIKLVIPKILFILVLCTMYFHHKEAIQLIDWFLCDRSVGHKWVNPFSVSPTKWSNTLKQFVGKSWQFLWVYLTILRCWCFKG